jgi:acyl carrier protein
MDELRSRLDKCFSAAFPKLAHDQIPDADTLNLKDWDSVASVTLFAIIEEEFGLELELSELPQLVSYRNILGYLRRHDARLNKAG